MSSSSGMGSLLVRVSRRRGGRRQLGPPSLLPAVRRRCRLPKGLAANVTAVLASEADLKYLGILVSGAPKAVRAVTGQLGLLR
jgi:hypothetical protein